MEEREGADLGGERREEREMDNVMEENDDGTTARESFSDEESLGEAESSYSGLVVGRIGSIRERAIR